MVAVVGAGIDQIGAVELLLLIHVEVPHTVQFQRDVIRQPEIQPLIHRKAVVRVPTVEVVLCRIPVTVLPVGRRDDLVAVGVVLAHRRRRREHDTEKVGLAAADVVAHLAAVRTREVQRTGRFEPRRDLVGAVGHERQTVVVRNHRETRLVVVAQTGVITSPLVAARGRDVVVLGERQIPNRCVARGKFAVNDRLARDRVDHALVALFQQVGILIRQKHRTINAGGRLVSISRQIVARSERTRRRKSRDIPRTIGGQTQVVEIVVGFEEFVRLAQVVQTDVRLERDLGTTDPAALGGHQNHTRVGPGAVKRRGGGILQDLDRLDVVGVDVVHVILLNAVDHVKRRSRTVERSSSADDVELEGKEAAAA